MGKNRNIRVRGVRRDEPDLRKLSRAILALVAAKHEADAEASHQAAQQPLQARKNRRKQAESQGGGGGS